MLGEHRVFPMVFGKTMNSHKDFMDYLKSNMKLREVSSENDSDVLIAFVPIVSRAGTDIQAALRNIPRHLYKHIILVALHHTYDPESSSPSSRHIAHRSDIFAVDCLFQENQGLLKCPSNHDALKGIIKHLVGEKSSTKAVDNTEWIFWILALLSSLIVYRVFPEEYSFFTYFIYEISLLILLFAIQIYLNHKKWTPCIFFIINIILFLIIFLITEYDKQNNQMDSEEGLNHNLDLSV